MKQLPSADYLHEALSYDPLTGALTWKTRPLHHFKRVRDQNAWNAQRAGTKAGCRDERYFILAVYGWHLLAHRIIWAMMTRTWPTLIDHINRDGHDNRWENLREATHQRNMWDRSRPETGLPRGVRHSRKGPRFTAQAKLNHKQIHLGSFDTPEEAHAAWRAFVEADRGEFFRAD